MSRNGDGGGGGGGGAVVPPRNGRGNNGIIPNSFRAFSSYLRIVSSGASSVASSVRSAASAASAIVERDNEANSDQVLWAGFDKLELERGISRRVLLLGYSYGFQVWDVEFADNVRNLVSRHDGPVSFLQMLPRPVASKHMGDKFSESHPLLIICADGSFSGGDSDQDGSGVFSNVSTQQNLGAVNINCVPTVVWFYSLRSQSYVHQLRFRSVVHLVRCSPRVVAVLQSSQIHCFNTATLEREYTILTNPVVTGCYGSGSIGFGPLAVGPRWMAYSGSQVAVSNSGRVSPQHLTPSASFPASSNGSLVAHYAKESSKQLAAGIVTLGDIGYKKLSRYYSELLPEGNNGQSGEARVKVYGVSNGHPPHGDDVGMVIVRDIVSKTVIAQFRAHKSPILSLCFDPSGILLVTASVQGHNINVFRIMPGHSEGSSEAASGPSYVHIYRLQRGFTNAIIQDISFSSDSKWIMISSSRGTSHLFAISPSGGTVSYQSIDASFNTRNNGRSLMTKHGVRGSSNPGLQVLTQQKVCVSGPPITLSAISRIRNGSNGWRNTVSGAAAAATGRAGSLSGAIASSFHNCKGNNMLGNISSADRSYHLLVFSPSGSLIQYALGLSPTSNGMPALSGVSNTGESEPDCDARLVVEALQKWNITQKQNRRERPDNIDLYGENGNLDSRKVHPERSEQSDNSLSGVLGTDEKEKITNEDKHHMYIAAAELRMHQNPYPLWARSQIYFQPILTDGSDVEGASGGEIEIEKIPVRTLEARSGDLIPVFEYLQAPKHQEGRVLVTNSGNNAQFRGRGFGVSDDDKVPTRSSAGYVDSLGDGRLVNNEAVNCVDETGLDGFPLGTEMTRGYVNTNVTPVENIRLENVNIRDDSLKEGQVRSVHNNRDGVDMENKFAEDDTDFG